MGILSFIEEMEMSCLEAVDKGCNIEINKGVSHRDLKDGKQIGYKQ